MTLTDPSVSTVFRDLQRILFLRIIFAVMVKDAVKAIGRPSGMNAMATETQSTINVGTLIQDGCFLRTYAALLQLVDNHHQWTGLTDQTIMTTTIIVTMMEQIMITKLRISRSRGVIPVFGAFVIFAILPKTVASPVDTTIPRPLPEMQWVP
jgi:hypothetical protein